ELSVESGFEFADKSIVSEDDNCMKLLVEQSLAKLTPAQREVVRLVYFEGYSQAEVAKIKGVHKTAINKQLIRALSQLKKYLENM
ncbi:MAG: sigma-70 family RNA polymerase sigma factor, partial [Clostridia bacterium]